MCSRESCETRGKRNLVKASNNAFTFKSYNSFSLFLQNPRILTCLRPEVSAWVVIRNPTLPPQPQQLPLTPHSLVFLLHSQISLVSKGTGKLWVQVWGRDQEQRWWVHLVKKPPLQLPGWYRGLGLRTSQWPLASQCDSWSDFWKTRGRGCDWEQVFPSKRAAWRAVIGAGSPPASGVSNRPLRGKNQVFLFLHLWLEGTACRSIRTSLENLCVTLLWVKGPLYIKGSPALEDNVLLREPTLPQVPSEAPLTSSQLCLVQLDCQWSLLWDWEIQDLDPTFLPGGKGASLTTHGLSQKL